MMNYDNLIKRLKADSDDWAGDGYIKRDLQDALAAIVILKAEKKATDRDFDDALRDLRELGDCTVCKYNKAPCPREDKGHKHCFVWRGEVEVYDGRHQ